MWIDRPVGRLRERSRTIMVVWIAHRHFFFASFGQSPCFAWIWVHVWLILGSSHVWVCIPWPRWILVKKPMGSWHHLLWGDTPLHFWPQWLFLHIHIWGGLPNCKWRICGLYLLSGRGIISFLHHPALWSFCPQGKNCSSWASYIISQWATNKTYFHKLPEFYTYTESKTDALTSLTFILKQTWLKHLDFVFYDFILDTGWISFNCGFFTLSFHQQCSMIKPCLISSPSFISGCCWGPTRDVQRL